jgi:hypothetical protein
MKLRRCRNNLPQEKNSTPEGKKIPLYRWKENTLHFLKNLKGELAENRSEGVALYLILQLPQNFLLIYL